MQSTPPKKNRKLILVVLVVVAIVVVVVLAALWSSGSFQPPVQLVNYDCYANPIGFATIAHWEGDLRNPANVPAHPVLDMYIDGASVRTRTYEIAAGSTYHFTEDYQRAGQDLNAHTCDVRLR